MQWIALAVLAVAACSDSRTAVPQLTVEQRAKAGAENDAAFAAFRSVCAQSPIAQNGSPSLEPAALTLEPLRPNGPAVFRSKEFRGAIVIGYNRKGSGSCALVADFDWNERTHPRFRALVNVIFAGVGHKPGPGGNGIVETKSSQDAAARYTLVLAYRQYKGILQNSKFAVVLNAARFDYDISVIDPFNLGQLHH